MLEMRSLFGEDTESSVLKSRVKINPSRSPFIRERIDVFFEEKEWQGVLDHVEELEIGTSSFKVVCLKNNDLDHMRFDERQKLAKELGLRISGTPELDQPDLLFAIMLVDGGWVFGRYQESETIWLWHQKKPHSYSTALSTRVARAVANIAVPSPEGIRAIDPCCGIGTVLVEALSMDIDIVGSDINPLILSGTRENLAHFGYATEVTYRDLHDVRDNYDVAIIDFPYNLCSVISPEEQLEMLQSTSEFANKVVLVSIQPIDSIIEKTPFKIADRCIVWKRKFAREIIVCEK